MGLFRRSSARCGPGTDEHAERESKLVRTHHAADPKGRSDNGRTSIGVDSGTRKLSGERLNAGNVTMYDFDSAVRLKSDENKIHSNGKIRSVRALQAEHRGREVLAILPAC